MLMRLVLETQNGAKVQYPFISMTNLMGYEGMFDVFLSAKRNEKICWILYTWFQDLGVNSDKKRFKNNT